MRKPFNLDLPTLDRMTLLIHGGYGKGKTHLAGDMLRHESVKGPVKFVNVQGEDGFASIGALGLGNVAETVENYDDIKAVIKELRAKPVRAVAFDSAKAMARLLRLWITGGEDRDLRVGDFKANEWSTHNREIESLFMSLRHCAEIVMVVCPSDKSTDSLTNKVLWTPDLPSRSAVNSAGWFDFVFVLDADVQPPSGPGQPPKVVRKLLTAPARDIVIRTRLPRPLPLEISIPQDKGGWDALHRAIQATFTTGGKA